MNRLRGGTAVVLAVLQLALAGCERKEAGGETAPGKAYVLAKPDYELPPGVVFEIRQNGGMNDVPVEIKGRDRRLEGVMNSYGEKFLRGEMVSETEASFRVIDNRQVNGFSVKDAPAPDQSVVSPMEGKTIVFRKEEGEWRAMEIDGHPVPEELAASAASYRRYLRSDEVSLFGADPRTVGEKWTCDSDIPADLLGLGEIQIGTIEMEFTGVEGHGGLECAVLVGAIDVVVETRLPGGGVMSMNFRGEMKTRRSTRFLYEVSTDVTGEVEIGGALDNGMTIGGRGNFRSSRTTKLTSP
ncbi:MAG: hypothetical protein HKN82_11445 [Akkermansiaceae bacterium]|nr:hypothetical protein [Akkermansiaceae bacterium]